MVRATLNPQHGRFIQSVLAREFSRWLFAIADRKIINIRKLYVGMTPAYRYIAHIICLRSQVQMIGIYADRIIAFVKNALFRGDFASVQHPSQSMRQDIDLIFATHSIPQRVTDPRSSPLNAFSRLAGSLLKFGLSPTVHEANYI